MTPDIRIFSIEKSPITLMDCEFINYMASTEIAY